MLEHSFATAYITAVLLRATLLIWEWLLGFLSTIRQIRNRVFGQYLGRRGNQQLENTCNENFSHLFLIWIGCIGKCRALGTLGHLLCQLEEINLETSYRIRFSGPLRPICEAETFMYMCVSTSSGILHHYRSFCGSFSSCRRNFSYWKEIRAFQTSLDDSVFKGGACLWLDTCP